MRLNVFLHTCGERLPVGVLDEPDGEILFEYDREFLGSGIELSPFMLPLRAGVFACRRL